ncbi:hypothetical protein BCR32DRAFT_293556 [Anaeromyces robustus]|uniref:Uncharacterized protein n=1 Tax=Anaeromyces robustus TaxID=1754192 RepID=A0A1Y1X523_9FUNG|nr:hypothetical protein BCR32DRAFT_293556 [Anaeromyces robustus]|eukprot:ORX80917.1 hypothetical protein BCR32DRAFT_293556 [Anaeromyces robustus]
MTTPNTKSPKNDISLNLDFDFLAHPQTPTPTSGQFARQNSISYRTSLLSGSLEDRRNGNDPEQEELIERFKSLQYNLKDVIDKVEKAKKENAQLNSENQILSKYINNLMSSTSGIS